METTVTPRAIAQQKYNSARANLLLMAGFTLINIALLFMNTDTMFLFSATVPYLFAVGGQVMGLELPAVAPFLYGIAAVCILLYFLCWIFSKNRYGWMIAALVLFILDTIAMVLIYLPGGFTEGILDALMHIWVLYYLIIGVKYGAQLKKLPPDPVDIPAELPEEPAEEIPAATEE